VAVVRENYTESEISKENFLDIQQAIGRLVDELPEAHPQVGWFLLGKGAAITFCHDESTKDWLAARVTTLVTW